MLNHIFIQGRLTKDLELRWTQSEKAVVSFAIACDRGRNNETDFIPCVAFSKTAEFISRNFNKGNMMLVDGRLQQSTWEDKSGNKRTSFDVLVNNVNFCGSKSNKSENPSPDVHFEELEGDDGDLPF